MIRLTACLLLLISASLPAAEPARSPLDVLDRGKIPARLKPPNNVPAETLVELGLRDGRWDTIAARPDGAMLAASDPAGAIVLWSLPSFKVAAQLNHPQVVALAFSADGKTLAAGDAKGNVRLWTLGAGKPTPRATLTAIHKEGPLWSLVFSPDGKLLATAGSDGDIKLWDLKPAKPALKSTIKAHEKVVRQLAFSPDSALLASAGSSDKVAKLWDVNGEPMEKAELKCNAAVASVSFSPDGKSLATASYDGNVRIWKIDDKAGPEFTSRMGRKSVRLVQFAPDGKSLAVLLLDDRGEHIAIRDRSGGKLHDWDFPHHVQGMVFIDARHLATANEDSVYILRVGD